VLSFLIYFDSVCFINFIESNLRSNLLLHVIAGLYHATSSTHQFSLSSLSGLKMARVEKSVKTKGTGTSTGTCVRAKNCWIAKKSCQFDHVKCFLV
jgi:hypothetical protein